MDIENKKAQHRDFVQAIITRLNGNSFKIKTLLITITAAFLGIYASNNNQLLLIFLCPLILLFWFLDSYYLLQEKKFRKIYNDICDLSPENEKITREVFQINPKLYKISFTEFLKTFFSISLMLIYPTLVILLIAVYLIF